MIPIKAKIDTGSSAMTVTEMMHAAHFSHIPIKPPAKILCNFDETPVQGIRGSFGIDVYCMDKHQHVWVYVTSDAASLVLGHNLIRPFKLIKLASGGSPEQVRRTDDKYA